MTKEEALERGRKWKGYITWCKRGCNKAEWRRVQQHSQNEQAEQSCK